MTIEDLHEGNMKNKKMQKRIIVLARKDVNSDL
jgi:hypothetical protein